MVAVRPEQLPPPLAGPVLALVGEPEPGRSAVRRPVQRDQAPTVRPEVTLAERDAWTAEWLRTADDAGVEDLQVLGYQAEWWDGAAFVPCLQVRWRATRWRVVAFDGTRAVALPRRARRARAVLAGYRAALADPVFTVPLAGLGALRSRRPVLRLPGQERDGIELVGAGEPRVARALAAQARSSAAAAVALAPDPAQPALFGIDLLHRAAADPELPRPRGRHRADRVVSVLAAGDAVVCSNASCGGLLLVPAPGHGPADEVCPRCGRR